MRAAPPPDPPSAPESATAAPPAAEGPHPEAAAAPPAPPGELPRAPAPPAGPCCFVAAKLDPATLARLDADLRASGPENSVSKVALRYGLRRTVVGNHRGCLGLRVPADAGTDDAAADLADEDGPATDERRMAVIAEVIAAGLWVGLPTVRTLAAKWGCSDAEVYRLHRHAARLVEAARGSVVAQRETAIATTRRLLHADEKSAERYDRAAARAYDKAAASAETDPARAAALLRSASAADAMARSHRAGALQAQRHLSELTVLKPAPVVQIQRPGVLDAAQVAPTFDRLRRVLDAVAPGVALLVEEGLGLYEDADDDRSGEDAFKAWLAERAANQRALPTTGYEVGGDTAPA